MILPSALTGLSTRIKKFKLNFDSSSELPISPVTWEKHSRKLAKFCTMAVVRWKGMLSAFAQLFVLAIIVERSNCLYDSDDSKVIMLDEKVRFLLVL